jgi:peptide/nickel transport system ATP-binding protein
MAATDDNTALAAPAVEIRDLRVTFTGGRKPVQAVNGVSLAVQRGEVVALIGESGSGKSVTLRTLLRLHNERRSQIAGQVQVAGHDVLAMGPRAGRLPRQGHVDDLPGAAAGAGPGLHRGRADRRIHPPA